MDKTRLEMLYERMTNFYHQWADMPRPNDWDGEPDNLRHNPIYLNRLGTFRSSEWALYIAARDIYYREYKQEQWH